MGQINEHSDSDSDSDSDYLVYVDSMSGWPVTFHFAKGNTTSRHTINACRRAFVALGVPVRFRSDAAPQFASRDFRQFLKRWGVNAVVSTPHYPQSNGLAEAAVKAMKKLIATTTVSGELPARSSRIPKHTTSGRPITCTNTVQTSIAIGSTRAQSSVL